MLYYINKTHFTYKKCYYSIFTIFKFTLTLHCRFPLFSLILHNIKFVQYVFTELDIFEKRILRTGQSFTVLRLCMSDSMLIKTDILPNYKYYYI
jgi:hypothetical protein